MGRAFELLSFLYDWMSPRDEGLEQSLPKPRKNLPKNKVEDKMPFERCDLCGLFGCIHINPNIGTDPIINKNDANGHDTASLEMSLGESIGSAISGTVITDPTLQERANRLIAGNYPITNVNPITSTIPMEGTKEARQRILIPPPPRVPLISGASSALVKSEQADEWVKCNICDARVCVRYLDNHLNVHTRNYTSTSPSRIPSRIVVRENTTSTPITPLVTQHTPKDTTPKLQSLEHYSYRPLDQACAASSMTQDNRYSDFTVIFWLKSRSTVYSNGYAGGTSTITKEHERLLIHIVYDSLEDYYTIASKLLKRSGYSSWDTEDTVPDRICYQDELFQEIKRIFLFFRISPRTAYKLFRKLFSQPILIEYDKNDRACIAQTENSDELNKRLSSAPTYHGYEGWSGHEGYDVG